MAKSHAPRRHRPKLLGRLVKRVHKAAGSAPGTLVHTGERTTDPVRIQLIDYDKESLEERTLERIEESFPLADDPPVSWVNIDGLHDVSVVEAVGERFGIHRLVLEDVLSTTQRPKVEEYENHYFCVLKMLSFDSETDSVIAEQLSLIVGPTWVFSFQERHGDVFEPVRDRIRHGRGKIRSRGTDYLAYALIDTIVDHYFRILEVIGDRIEELEESVLNGATIETLHRIHHLRREVLVLRRAIWPLRETLGTMYRGEIPNITEETQIYLRDVYDHAVQVIDTVETLREVLSGAMDLYMSGVSNRMNEVMKVLTIIATIFIPLSFFAGLYGMNFEYMPELSVRWAYPTLLAFMASIAVGMLWFFKKRDWL
ncbi:MAG: magnesium/cobalt transporter CorA [Gemmatimonadota bacterium]|nr:magnesium/cobalt transporter CorA [Gemmatimonadota bacterium]MDH3424746.1 magnesium/cobalt transporter CorA [Gemmatimonadota bacterium]